MIRNGVFCRIFAVNNNQTNYETIDSDNACYHGCVACGMG